MPHNRNVPAPLPAWEQGVYWLVEGATLLYMFLSLYHASQDARAKNAPIQLGEGWGLLGRPMDVADTEWVFWASYLWRLLPWALGHVLLSGAVLTFTPSIKVKASVWAVYGLVVTSYLLGVRTVAVFCLLPVVLVLVVKAGGGVRAVWVASLAFLTTLNVWETALFQWAQSRYGDDSDLDTWFYVCVFVWGGLFQRATAFALECVWVRQAQQAAMGGGDRANNSGGSDNSGHPPPLTSSHGQQVTRTDHSPHVSAMPTEGENRGIDTVSNHSHHHQPPLTGSAYPTVPHPVPQIPGWMDMFLYVFYFPLFFTGPLVVYNKFHQQVREPQRLTMVRVRSIVWRLVRVLVWGGLHTVILHFLYPHAINGSPEVLQQQTRWTVAAIGYSLGQLFMVKYVFLFGLLAQLARLDGFDPPDVPACISYVYCYSNMWRSFDRGLYDFMTRYIFIPSGGSRAGLASRVLGAVLCFAFVFYWHGAELYLFLWCLLNFLETSLEQLGSWLEGREVVQARVYCRLSPAGVRRVRAVMSVPMFLMAVFGIFYFFGGTGSGLVFLHKLLIHIPWGSLAVFLVLVYCAVQNAMEVERLGFTKLHCRRRTQ